jgi:hypothetical protein
MEVLGKHDELEESRTLLTSETFVALLPKESSRDAMNVVLPGNGNEGIVAPPSELGSNCNWIDVGTELNGKTLRVNGKTSWAIIPEKFTETGPHCSTDEKARGNSVAKVASGT